jgi:hypothetical protein
MAVQVTTGQVQNTISFTETAALAFNALAPYAVTLGNGSINYVNLTGGAGTLATATSQGVGNIDTVYANQFTLASTSQAIDLFGGSLLSPSGKACVFARVREFIVQVVSTTANYLVQIYGSASNAPLWLPLVATYLWTTPGGLFRMSDPNSITTGGYLVDTSHKAITFNSASNTVVFNVLITGNSSQS